MNDKYCRKKITPICFPNRVFIANNIGENNTQSVPTTHKNQRPSFVESMSLTQTVSQYHRLVKESFGIK